MNKFTQKGLKEDVLASLKAVAVPDTFTPAQAAQVETLKGFIASEIGIAPGTAVAVNVSVTGGTPNSRTVTCTVNTLF